MGIRKKIFPKKKAFIENKRTMKEQTKKNKQWEEKTIDLDSIDNEPYLVETMMKNLIVMAKPYDYLFICRVSTNVRYISFFLSWVHDFPQWWISECKLHMTRLNCNKYATC